MVCPQTKRVGGKDWPLYRRTTSGQCCYVVNTDSRAKAAALAEEAARLPGYAKRSRFYDMPGTAIRFYLYFRGS